MRQAGFETENRFERHVGLMETLSVACVGCGAKPLGRVTALKSFGDFSPGDERAADSGFSLENVNVFQCL